LQSGALFWSSLSQDSKEMDTVLPPPFRKIVGQKRLKAIATLNAWILYKLVGMQMLTLRSKMSEGLPLYSHMQ